MVLTKQELQNLLQKQNKELKEDSENTSKNRRNIMPNKANFFWNNLKNRHR